MLLQGARLVTIKDCIASSCIKYNYSFLLRTFVNLAFYICYTIYGLTVCGFFVDLLKKIEVR